jgi:hypothetical protein
MHTGAAHAVGRSPCASFRPFDSLRGCGMAGSDPTDAERERRVLFWNACAAMAVGVAVRVLFLADKPFWRDEAWVALIASDPMQAALDGRVAPFGFLWLTAVASWLPIAAEISYRLLPLAAGIACIPAIALLATTFGASRRTAVVAMWLAAGLPPFVYFSRELKSYGLDLLFAIVIPLLGARGFAERYDSSRARTAFGATIAVVPWLSFSGIFAVASFLGIGWLRVVWEARRGGLAQRRDRVVAWLAASFAFTASFAAVYWIALRHQASDPWIQRYWSSVLNADDGLGLPLGVLFWTWKSLQVSTLFVFDFYAPAFVVLAALGLVAWPRTGAAPLVAYWLIAATLCGAAAAIDRYLIIHGRLLMFLAPVPVLLAANGIVETGRRVGARRGPALALAAAVALSALPAYLAVRHRVTPFRMLPSHFFRYDLRHDVDAAIEACLRRGLADAPVFVSRRSSYAFRFYNRDRLRNAWVCTHRCDDYPAIARGYFEQVADVGWGIVLDEDVGNLSAALAARGFQFRPVERFDSTSLWEITRVPGFTPRQPQQNVMGPPRPPTFVGPPRPPTFVGPPEPPALMDPRDRAF